MRLLIEHRADINVRARPQGLLRREEGGRWFVSEVGKWPWKKMKTYSKKKERQAKTRWAIWCNQRRHEQVSVGRKCVMICDILLGTSSCRSRPPMVGIHRSSIRWDLAAGLLKFVCQSLRAYVPWWRPWPCSLLVSSPMVWNLEDTPHFVKITFFFSGFLGFENHWAPNRPPASH